MGRTGREQVDVLLVCSCGGHLLQLHTLAAAFSEHTRVWVTFDKSDSRSLLAGERVVYAHGPTNRSLTNLLRNVLLAIKTVARLRPAVVVSTGAGVAVPFAWVGRLFGARVIYVESITRVRDVSLTCRLVRPVAARVFVQWEELLPLVPSARYAGTLFVS
jgi:UDP-N-acetylglucosamine:LPS N-acetylglucosamine transferase